MTLVTGHLIKSIDLGGVPESVGEARAFIRDVVGGNHPAIETAMLLGSELVSNSVRHSYSGQRVGGRLTVAVVTKAGELIHVAVIDEGSAEEIPEIPPQIDELSESGRGLWLVRTLSSAWGWQDSAMGRAVWFEVSRS